MKKPPESVNGSYTAIPHRVLDSLAFTGASDRAKSFLFALMRQHNGNNNGRFQLTDKWLARQGWASASLNVKARTELIERGLVVQTRWGGLNMGASWFALTWLPISNFVKLDISASAYHQGAWGNCKLQPTTRRKPPQKYKKRSDHRSGTTLTNGVAEYPATPTIGAETAHLGVSTAPTNGNDVLPPLSLNKPARIKKRIVGKAGHSGIPKELHQEVAAP